MTNVTQQVTPQWVAPSKPRFFARRWVQLVGVGVAGVVVGATAGAAGSSTQPTTKPAAPADSTRPAASTAPAETESPAPVVTPPAAAFAVTLKVLSKECFGSAGCNITYRPHLSYSGFPLESGTTWEITYSVTGGDDPIVGTLSVDGTSVTGPQEESTGTPRAAAKLVATVTSVESVG